MTSIFIVNKNMSIKNKKYKIKNLKRQLIIEQEIFDRENFIKKQSKTGPAQ